MTEEFILATKAICSLRQQTFKILPKTFPTTVPVALKYAIQITDFVFL